jgi:hypothetical protein
VAVHHRRIVGDAQVLGQREQPGHVGAELPAGGEVDAFGGERAPCHPPAVVHLADDPVVGHEHLVEEDLVEDLVPGELPQRAYVDAW